MNVLRLRVIIKPDAVFDTDDYNTIDQLKVALSSIKGYQFTYLTNHNTLITDLIKLQQKTNFALNLCDEGFELLIETAGNMPIKNIDNLYPTI